MFVARSVNWIGVSLPLSIAEMFLYISRLFSAKVNFIAATRSSWKNTL